MKRLNLELLKQLFPGALVRDYAKNQIVCYQGDQPNQVYFIISGHVRYYDIDISGNEKVIHINGPSYIFPMLYAFKISPEVSGFYSCIDKVKLMVISMEDFHRVIESDINFSNSLIHWFLFEIEELASRLNAMEKTDARDKILYALVSLTRHYGHISGSWSTIDFPITRQFMADYTGLARETVSTTMTELERDKTIRKGPLRTLEVKVKALPKT